jgi:hypothetical protein
METVNDDSKTPVYRADHGNHTRSACHGSREPRRFAAFRTGRLFQRVAHRKRYGMPSSTTRRRIYDGTLEQHQHPLRTVQLLIRPGRPPAVAFGSVSIAVNLNASAVPEAAAWTWRKSGWR